MPRLGNNGGLMGLRRVPSTGSASGVWDSDEQSLAKRAGIWPAPASDITLSSISYLYHVPSLDYRVVPPSVANMQDGSEATGTFIDALTGGAPGNLAFVTMDLGQLKLIEKIVYGPTPSGTVWTGGFYQNANIHYSLDNATWTFLLNVGDYSGIQQQAVQIEARYIRISKSNYLGLSEFYALAPGQIHTPPA